MAEESLPSIQRGVVAAVIRQLEIAQGRVVAALAGASEGARAQLEWQRDEIARALAAFHKSVTELGLDGARRAWISGVASIERPTTAAGAPLLAPRIDGRTLVAMEEFLTDRIKDVSQEALAKINETLAQHIIGTKPLSEAITDVQRILGGDSRRRAMTIVFTEVGRVHAAAQYESLLEQAKRIPGLQKRWKKSGKKHPRAGHVLADSQTVPVADPFQIVDLKTGEVESLRFPRDPKASAANTINCGCMMVPVLPKVVATHVPAPESVATAEPVPPQGAALAPIESPRIVQDAGGILPPEPPAGGGGDPPAPFRPPRAPWGDGLPLVNLHAVERAVKHHPSYAAAKAGDLAAAARLIEDMADRELIDALIDRYAPLQPTLVPVHAEETDGKNIIPIALAAFIRARTGWPVELGLIQANKVGRTGQDGYYRLAIQPLFEGPVSAAPHFLIDDFLGQGATLANLRGHILAHGGTVVGASALTGKSVSAMLALSPSTLAELRTVHGTALENWWRELFGYGFDSLTESEARYLIRRTDADRIRKEILARLGEDR